MLYAFATGSLTEDRYKLAVRNITLEVVEGEVNQKIANPCLNGKFTIKGIFENVTLANQNKIKKGGFYELRIQHEGHWTILPILVLALLETTEAGRFQHCQTWLFCGIRRPTHDRIGLLPDPGEISLDDLLNMIGSSRGQMEREKCAFTNEGGLSG